MSDVVEVSCDGVDDGKRFARTLLKRRGGIVPPGVSPVSGDIMYSCPGARSWHALAVARPH